MKHTVEKRKRLDLRVYTITCACMTLRVNTITCACTNYV